MTDQTKSLTSKVLTSAGRPRISLPEALLYKDIATFYINHFSSHRSLNAAISICGISIVSLIADDLQNQSDCLIAHVAVIGLKLWINIVLKHNLTPSRRPDISSIADLYFHRTPSNCLVEPLRRLLTKLSYQPLNTISTSKPKLAFASKIGVSKIGEPIRTEFLSPVECFLLMSPKAKGFLEIDKFSMTFYGSPSIQIVLPNWAATPQFSADNLLLISVDPDTIKEVAVECHGVEVQQKFIFEFPEHVSTRQIAHFLNQCSNSTRTFLNRLSIASTRHSPHQRGALSDSNGSTPTNKSPPPELVSDSIELLSPNQTPKRRVDCRPSQKRQCPGSAKGGGIWCTPPGLEPSSGQTLDPIPDAPNKKRCIISSSRLNSMAVSGGRRIRAPPMEDKKQLLRIESEEDISVVHYASRRRHEIKKFRSLTSAIRTTSKNLERLVYLACKEMESIVKKNV